MKFFATVILYSLIVLPMFSQEEVQVEQEDADKEGFKIKGSIDVYYRANFGADFDFAPATAFANLPGFSLGMANVILDYEKKKTGFTVDLVFGPRGEDATFLSEELRPGGISKVVNQLNAFWNINDKITATIGNFNTFLGYEVISPLDNFNYSTSYMFSYGPFSHTGVKLDFDLGNNFTLMAGVFNPTDATEYNPLNKYSTGLQLGYENNGLGVWVNSLFSDDFYQFDLTAGYDFSDKIYFGLNSTIAKDAFYGVATYLKVTTSEFLTIGARIEYFHDAGLGIEMIGNEQSVLDVTISANIQIGSLTLIPEYRLDIFSTKGVVPNKSESGNTLNSFVLAAVHDF